MRSIRRQLTLWCSVAIALMLAILGIGLYLTLSHSLEAQFNGSLIARATLLVNTLDWDPHRGFHIISDFTPVADGKTQGLPRYFQIWTSNGKSVLHPSTLGKRDLKFMIPSQNPDSFADIILPNDLDGRELVIRFREGHGDEDQPDQPHDEPAHDGEDRKDRPDSGVDAVHLPHHYILAVARPISCP